MAIFVLQLCTLHTTTCSLFGETVSLCRVLMLFSLRRMHLASVTGPLMFPINFFSIMFAPKSRNMAIQKKILCHCHSVPQVLFKNCAHDNLLWSAIPVWTRIMMSQTCQEGNSLFWYGICPQKLPCHNIPKYDHDWVLVLQSTNFFLKKNLLKTHWGNPIFQNKENGWR